MGAGCSSDHGGYRSNIIGSGVPNLKIAIVGDTEVGKTCIMLRYLKNQFSPMYIPTKKAVIESAVKKINVPGHTVASLTIWDIPGREDMDLHKTYFRDLDAAIVVVDLTEMNSIEMAPVWKQTILNNTFVTCPVKEASHGGQVKTMTMEEHPVDKETFPVLLVGNKFDVIEQKVQAERLKKYAQESQETEGEEKRVWSLGGPLTEEEKPECIKLLEKQAEDHSFHASVMVSARDGDGSVREAMQNLVRHVLENKYSMKKYRNKGYSKKHKEKRKKEIEGLDKTGIKSFDTEFISANTSVKKITTLREFYNKSLTKFKEGCQLAQIVEKEENSLEDCVAALKKNIGEGAKLKVKKDEDFCKLKVSSKDEDFKPAKKIRILLNIFHTEYASVCKSIQKDCHLLDKKLQQQDEAIETMCKECWEEVATAEQGQPRSEQEIKRITDIIETNRAKMQHACLEARAAVSVVEDAMKKIKTAFLW